METTSIERRAIAGPVKISQGRRQIGGKAAIFNTESRLIPRGYAGSFKERIVPSFFNEARAAGWPGNQGAGVMCRYNHNDQYLLGNTSAGTCQLTLDRNGLEYRAEVPNCRDDVLELVTRGDIRNSSFTFIDAQDDWSYSNGVPLRTLITGGVIDVAPVSAVAGYADTTVGLRSLAHHMEAPCEDVFALAEQDRLDKLFVRTDRPARQPWFSTQSASDHERNNPPMTERTMTWREAKLRLLAIRPDDPIRHEPTTMSADEATLRLERLRQKGEQTRRIAASR